MFAIIKTGGKQYKVSTNDVIMVEKMDGASGDSIEFSDVLMMEQGGSVKVGAPLVADARVRGTVLDQIRDDKVIIFKKTQRHTYRRKNGHRQYLTVIRITDILSGKAEPKAAAPVKKEAAPVKEAKAEVPAKETKTASAKKAPAKSKKSDKE